MARVGLESREVKAWRGKPGVVPGKPASTQERSDGTWADDQGALTRPETRQGWRAHRARGPATPAD
jgi:hypothetical protein